MKPLLVLVEGAQGVGKTTLTTQLRENWTSTNLLRLSGLPNKEQEASLTSLNYHSSVLNLILENRSSGLDWVLDRSYLSDKVYASLGYKAYDFEKETMWLNEKLKQMTRFYEVWVVVLTTEKEVYEERLKRDKGTYQAFSVMSSLKQQDAYLKEIRALDKAVRVFILDNSEGKSFHALNQLKQSRVRKGAQNESY